MNKNNHFSRKISHFHGRTTPNSDMTLVGYGALISGLNLQVPLPDILSLIGNKHKKMAYDEWTVYTPRHMPEDTLFDHLVFALKYEGLDLAILKAVFTSLSSETIEAMVLKEPTGQYCRRIWFLYEWLCDKKLNIPDAKTGNFADVLDEKLQYGAKSERSSRHRINNNLPGSRAFCPLIRKTEKIKSYIELNLKDLAQDTVTSTPNDILLRASAFLLLNDSKSSFAIEGESPTQQQALHWSHAIGEAGKYTLTKDLILKLQSILISDARFTQLGWRKDNGFVGAHDHRTGEPLPDHISAKPEDLNSLLDGMIYANNKLSISNIDPVLHAALISFGFVFIHPLEDGNGRLHRYLIHHVLAERSFTPNGMIFPISFIMLEKIEDYKRVLEYYSQARLRFINWSPTQQGNVEVINNTSDLYRYFDATKQAEFLYECVRLTVEETLPKETEYLECYDRMKAFLASHFDMPENTISLLIRFLEQNQGLLSKRAMTKEFSKFTDHEIADIENSYREIFMR